MVGLAVPAGIAQQGTDSGSAAETATALPELLQRAVAESADEAALEELRRRGATVHRYLVGRLRNPGSGTIPHRLGDAFGDLAAMSAADRVALRVLAQSPQLGASSRVAAELVARLDPPGTAVAAVRTPAAQPVAVPGPSIVDAPRDALWVAVEAWLVDADRATEALEALLVRRVATPPDDREGHAQLDRIERALRDWASASSSLEPRTWRWLAGPTRRSEWAWIGLSGGADFGPATKGRVEALLAAAADEDPAVRAAAALGLRTAAPRDPQVEAALLVLMDDTVPAVAGRAELVHGALVAKRRAEAVARLPGLREGLRAGSIEQVVAALQRIHALGPDAGELAAELFALGLTVEPPAGAEGSASARDMPATELRRWIVSTLAALGDAVVDVLDEALRSEDVAARTLAAQVLSRFPSVPAAAARLVILAVYADPEPAVRRAAEPAVARLPAASAGPALIGLLWDRRELRDPLLRALVELSMYPGWREVISAHGHRITELITGDDDPGDAVREQVFKLLGRCDRLPANQRALLAHRDARVRHGALRLLFAPAHRGPEWFDAVEARLADDEEAVREFALQILPGFEVEPERLAAALLRHAPEFEAPAVRLACVRAAVRVGPAAAGLDATFAGWIDSPTDALRLAVETFRLACRPTSPLAGAAEAALRARLADPDPTRRAATMLEMTRAGAGALPLLDAVLAGLDDPDPGVQKWAVYCLRDLGPAAAAALPRLEALRDAMPGSIEAQRVGEAIEAIRR